LLTLQFNIEERITIVWGLSPSAFVHPAVDGAQTVSWRNFNDNRKKTA
jgi:hypothetical protein